jgi:Sulfotransferase family
MLQLDDLIGQARSRVPGCDFLETGFMPGLEVLVDSLNRESDLSAENLSLVEKRLVHILVNRLRMDRDFAQHAEIESEVVQPPVAITHLPRTGSTKLHRLLAATGEFLSMQTWQEHNIAPLPGSTGMEPDPRIKDAYEYIAWIESRSPDALIGHPMAAEEVEEETLLLDLGFRSPYMHLAFYEVPSYAQWLMTQDPAEAYRDLKRMLQYLQWQYSPGTTRRWILKTPCHLGNEGALVEVFPGIQFLMTHRDPLKMMASSCSAFCSQRLIFSEGDLSHIAGAWCINAFDQLMKNHLSWRDGPGQKEAILDVGFKQLSQNEMGCLEDIFTFLGYEMSPEAVENAQHWLEGQANKPWQRHAYALSDYGLTEEMVHSVFDDYRTRFSGLILG